MKGITHITLTMLTALVILAPLTNFLLTLAALPAVIFLFLGTFLGSLTPDIDKGKEAAIYHAEIPGAGGKKFHLTPIFGYVINYACYKPIHFVFRLIFGKKIYAIHGHRELPHSPIGILFISAMLTAYIWFICFALSFLPYLGFLYNPALIFLFGIGFLLGCFLHLVEDTCDNSGIHYFYPFSFSRLRGTVRSDGTDKRPAVFAVILLFAAVILFSLTILRLIPQEFSGALAVIVPIILWILILKASGVPARKEIRE